MGHPHRARTLSRLVLSAMTVLWASQPMAQTGDWPNRPIRIIVPVAAGGIIDILARLVADKLSPELRQPIVVEQRPGADQVIGMAAVAASEPDGYTWLAGATPLTVNPFLKDKVPYDPLKSFVGVTLLATVPNVAVVPPAVPASTLAEFIALARSQPGKLSYANPGNGSSNHLGTELLKSAASIDLVSVVYRGQPPATADLLANRVNFMLMSTALAVEQVRAGSLKALAFVSPTRSPLLPDVPTMGEAGYPQVDVVPWIGILMPAETPRPIVDRVNELINKMLREPEVNAQMARIGATPYPANSPATFEGLIREEMAKWPKIIESAKIQR